MAHKKPGKNKNKPKGSKAAPNNQKADFLDKLNMFFAKRQKLFLLLSFIFTVIFAILLFNFKISFGTDDSDYIKKAYNIVHNFKFPTFHGPFYPFVLSFFIWIFGLNLTFLKALSVVFILGHLYFFYRSFKERIPYSILFFVLLIISFNAFIMNYASLTFSEALFMLIQAAFFYVFFVYVIDRKFHPTNARDYVGYLLFGLIALLLAKTRTVGYGALVASLVYLLFHGQWQKALASTGGFGVFYLIFSGIKRFIFNVESSHQFGTQLDRLMRVDPYDASKGKEDFIGFLERFWENSHLYLSKHLYKFVGLKVDPSDISVFLTILTYILFFIAIYYVFRRNKYLLFTGIYIAAMCGITFVILQTRWDQYRFILVFFPLILVFIFSGLYYLAKRYPFLQIVLPALMIFMFITNFSTTQQKVEAHKDDLVNYIRGNKYYGLTPDWVNYLKMSEYAAKNVPEDVTIACRKPTISFVYAKRDFYGIYRINTKDPDKLLNRLKKHNVHYVIMANLRKYPSKKTKYTINTVKRYLYYLRQKYSDMIQAVHKIGYDEEAYLFKINYN